MPLSNINPAQLQQLSGQLGGLFGGLGGGVPFGGAAGGPAQRPIGGPQPSQPTSSPVGGAGSYGSVNMPWGSAFPSQQVTMGQQTANPFNISYNGPSMTGGQNTGPLSSPNSGNTVGRVNLSGQTQPPTRFGSI